MSSDLRIGVSGRVLDRHVGGNTTYARRLYEHLEKDGVLAHVLRPPGTARLSSKLRSVEYFVFESAFAQIRAAHLGLSAIHFPADTGPLSKIVTVPLVVTVHGAAALHEPAVRRRAPQRIWTERTCRAIRAADVVITVSESSATDIRRLVHPHPVRIEVIPHGVDHDVFRPASHIEIKEARHRHGVARPFAFYYGNLEPRKNLVSLVQAIDDMNAAGVDLELLVAGKPAWDAEATLEAIKASPHARRLGWIDDGDLRGLLSDCAMFVFPSLYEGFGLPVLEAMACGAPVVCTRRGSLPEVAGDVAIFADGPTRDGLAQAMHTCLSAARQMMSTEGVQRAAQYVWSLSAQRHREVFESVT